MCSGAAQIMTGRTKAMAGQLSPRPSARTQSRVVEKFADAATATDSMEAYSGRIGLDSCPRCSSIQVCGRTRKKMEPLRRRALRASRIGRVGTIYTRPLRRALHQGIIERLWKRYFTRKNSNEQKEQQRLLHGGFANPMDPEDHSTNCPPQRGIAGEGTALKSHI